MRRKIMFKMPFDISHIFKVITVPLPNRGIKFHKSVGYIYIQGVPGGMCQTSGECFLC